MVVHAIQRRLVVITNIIAPYRVPTLRELARRVSLTVLFSAGSQSDQNWPLPRELPFSYEIVGGRDIPRGRPQPIYVSTRLLQRLYALRPHAVIVGGYSVPALYSALYCKGTGAGLILFSEGTCESEAGIGRLSRLARIALAPRADGAIGVSSAALSRFADLGIPRDRCFCAPYALDLADRPVRTFEGGSVTRLLCVGRLVAGKGVPELLRDLAALRDERICLSIAGTGQEQRMLEAMAQNLGLGKRVVFLGFVDQADLPELYARHDLVAFPTMSDTFGVVTLEAMAAGLPVVASIHAGSTTDFVVDERNGWTCDPTQPGSIARALRVALERRSSWPEIGRHNRQVIERANPAASAEQIVSAMHLAVASRR